MFIFILQGVWLYISELAGKDLDVSVTLKFIIYYMPKLIPLVVPLTVLLSSIMVFGNFAENYEFAAMKSTGISLQRAMRSLSAFIVILGIACFFFSNNVIPWGEYNFYNLRRNIAKVKPALALAEGQFNEIGDTTIKVDKKSGENGEFLEGVVMHQKSPSRRGNFKVIIAEKGELKSSPNSSILQLELQNGHYYEELRSKKSEFNRKKPHVKSYFETYVVNVDLEILNTEDLDDKNYSNRYNMLNVNQLVQTIDSLTERRKTDYDLRATTLYNRTTFQSLKADYMKPHDSIPRYEGDDVLELFNDKKKIQVLSLALNSANSTNQVIESNMRSMDGKETNFNKHVIALHDKFVLAIACVILFFVGAPLGALIRKGGLGLPIVIAIVLFLTYHFFGIFAKNSAEKGSFSPIIGSWLSTAVMLPLSIYLTNRATNDKGIFQLDAIIVPFKRLFSPKSNFRLSESETKEYNFYKKYSIEQLVEIIKSQDEYALNKKPKEIALHNLLNRNITLEGLESEGLDVPKFLKKGKRILKDYKDYSKTSLVSFGIGGALLILHFIFKNNKFPEMADASLNLSLVAFVFFGIYVIVDAIYYTKFNVALSLERKKINPLVHLLTLPVYPLKYLVLRNKIDQDFYRSCFKNIN